MRTSDVDILTVPGWSGADAGHWMSRWERGLKTARRVEQDDWHRPGPAWGVRILEAVQGSARPVVLVAHSCGVAVTVHVAGRLGVGGQPGQVAGAFLVAPGEEAEVAALPGADPSLVPYPRLPLPFPSVLVASRNDPHCTYKTATALAASWGSLLADAGESGHLNVASGHGPWPDGLLRFGLFLKTLG